MTLVDRRLTPGLEPARAAFGRLQDLVALGEERGADAAAWLATIEQTLRALEELATELAAANVAPSRAGVSAIASGAVPPAAADLSGVVESVARGLCEATGDGVVVALLSPDRNWLLPVAVSHPDERARDRLRALVGTNPLPRTSTAREVASSGQPAIASTREKIRALLGVEAAAILSPCTVMLAPLRVHRRAIGVVLLLPTRPATIYGTQDAALVQRLADRAATTIEDARVIDAVADSRARQVHAEHAVRILGELGSALLGADLSATQVADIVLSHSCTAVGANEGTFTLLGGEGSPRVVARKGAVEPTVRTTRVDVVGAAREIGYLDVAIESDDAREGAHVVLRTIAKFAGHAIERAAIRDRERAARGRLAILASAGDAFERARGRDEIGAALTGLLVPQIGDRCGSRPAEAEPSRTIDGMLVDGAIHVLRDEARAPFDDDDRALVGELLRRADLAIERVALLHKTQEAVAVRDRFLAVAGHELRTPISALNVYAWSVASGAIEREEAMTLVGRQVARLDRLVDQLLDFSRISGRRLALDRERVDLVELARNAIDQAKLATPDVEILVEAPAAPVLGTWDAMRLEQVVTNLLSNAVRYGGSKPVSVSIDRVGDRARLAVRDHGVGIDPAAQARIFDRYFRVADHADGGLGLGLWIARYVVEEHGGSIAVESTPGDGARFIVELPAD